MRIFVILLLTLATTLQAQTVKVDTALSQQELEGSRFFWSTLVEVYSSMSDRERVINHYIDRLGLGKDDAGVFRTVLANHVLQLNPIRDQARAAISRGSDQATFQALVQRRRNIELETSQALISGLTPSVAARFRALVGQRLFSVAEARAIVSQGIR